MNCCVLMAHVPDTASIIKIGPAGNRIDETGIKWIVSPYDEYALEGALKAKEASGGAVTAVTFGPARADARNHLQEHEKIVLYHIWLWRIRSTYLFYADRDISAAVEDTDALIAMVRAGTARYCLAGREHAAELSSLDSVQTEIQAETPSLILFKMTEVPPSV